MGRLTDFLADTAVPNWSCEPLIIEWPGHLYYYSWKYGGHSELASDILPMARTLILNGFVRGDDELKVTAIRSASSLTSWLTQSKNDEARPIADFLAKICHSPLMPAEGRKIAGLTLATNVGAHTNIPPWTWAKKLLADHGDSLEQHERIPVLVASFSSPEESATRFDDVLAEVERFVEELEKQMQRDPAAMAFRQVQLFEVIGPMIRNLVAIGRCQRATQLMASWFGVPAGRRRSCAALHAIPGHSEGAFYAVEGKTILIPRDTDAVLRKVTNAFNSTVDLNLVMRDDHSFEPNQTSGRWATGERHRATLESAIAARVSRRRAAGLRWTFHAAQLFPAAQLVIDA